MNSFRIYHYCCYRRGKWGATTAIGHLTWPTNLLCLMAHKTHFPYLPQKSPQSPCMLQIFHKIILLPMLTTVGYIYILPQTVTSTLPGSIISFLQTTFFLFIIIFKDVCKRKLRLIGIDPSSREQLARWQRHLVPYRKESWRIRKRYQPETKLEEEKKQSRIFV